MPLGTTEKPAVAPAPFNLSTWMSGLGGQIGSSNPSVGLAGAIGAGAAPTIAGTNLSMADLLGQIGQVPGQIATQAQEQTLGAEYGLAGLGIQNQQNVLSEQDLAAQASLAGTQQGLEQAQYGLQSGQFPEQLAQATQQFQTAQQGLQGSLASSGTLGTPGSKLQQANLAQNYGWQKEDIARNQQLAALGQKSEEAGYGYNVGALARQQQNLELAAQQNGISVDQLVNQWQSGLNQLGTQGQQTVQGLYTQYLTGEGQQVQNIGGMLGSAGLLGGINPNSALAGVR